MKKHNYLNNKDILKEIHKSKTSYCCFTNTEDSVYDIIVEDASMIDADLIVSAKQLRCDRLAKEAQEVELAKGNKCKLDEFKVPLDDIPIEDIVIRVMTWEHIPIDEVKQSKSDARAQEQYDKEFKRYGDEEFEYHDSVKGPIKYSKVNFPPFFHYKVSMKSDSEVTYSILKKDPYFNLHVIGKSHWQGDIIDGTFNARHGNMTDKLARMFMKLCERYATRSNWRGYTYNDEMRGQALLQLSQIGLQFNEAKSQNPFAYYTAAITNSFTRVLNDEKKNQNIRDDILEQNNLNPSYTRQNERGGESWGTDD